MHLSIHYCSESKKFRVWKISNTVVTIVKHDNYMAIAHLPRLVQEAISSACDSDRQLSWKTQENAKGTLIQLVWKPALTVVPRQKKANMVGSNWNTNVQPSFSMAQSVFTSRSGKKRRNPPSLVSAGVPSA